MNKERYYGGTLNLFLLLWLIVLIFLDPFFDSLSSLILVLIRNSIVSNFIRAHTSVFYSPSFYYVSSQSSLIFFSLVPMSVLGINANEIGVLLNYEVVGYPLLSKYQECRNINEKTLFERFISQGASTCSGSDAKFLCYVL